MPTSHLPDNHVQRLLGFSEETYLKAYLRLFLDIQGDIDINEIAEDLSKRDIATISQKINIIIRDQAGPRIKKSDEDVIDEINNTIGGYLFDQHNVVIGQTTVQRLASLYVLDGTVKLENIADTAQETIRQIIIRDSFGLGLNPVDVARNIHDRVNLTTLQEFWVDNYVKELRGDRRMNFGRLLVTPSEQETIRQAGGDISGDIVERLKKRYTERMQRQRAKTIARTESLRGLHMGSQEFYDEAQRTGQIDTTEKEWLTARDIRVREPLHTSLNGVRKAMRDVFIDPEGNALLHPGDRSHGASAKTLVNCRCIIRYLITSVQ